jgi:hypothetical protein
MTGFRETNSPRASRRQAEPWQKYATGIEALQLAIAEIDLVDLKGIRDFLVESMAATGDTTDLERSKLKAAEQQLALIEAAIVFMNEASRIISKLGDKQ